MLSADTLLTAAFAGVTTAQMQKPVVAVHEEIPVSQGILSEGITYHQAASGANGIFDGISDQAVQSRPATAEKPVTQTTAQTDNHSGQSPATTSTVNEADTTQNSTTTVQTTLRVETVTANTASTELATANSTISATSTSGTSNPMTQQLTTSLTAANGPPANSLVSQASSNQTVTSTSSSSNNSGSLVVASQNVSIASNSDPVPNGVSTDLTTIINTELGQYANGSVTGTQTQTETNVELGNVLGFSSVTLTYNITNNGGTLSGTVTLTGTSATLFPGSATINGSIAPTSGSPGTLGTFTLGAGTYDATTNPYAGAYDFTASTVTFQFSPNTNYYGLSVSASGVNINVNATPLASTGDTPTAQNTYISIISRAFSFTIGPALSPISITGTATDFSVINDATGTPAFYAGSNFGFTMGSSLQLSDFGLPEWMASGGAAISLQFNWGNFATNPTNFSLEIVSASISSLGGGLATYANILTVSGSISDLVINLNDWSSWLASPTSVNFPISFGPQGAIAGSISTNGDAKFLGLANFSATFVGGMTIFNAEGDLLQVDPSHAGQYVLDPSYATANLNPTQQHGIDINDTTYYGSGIFTGVAGTAKIDGLGTLGVSMGFTNFGPVSFYLSLNVEPADAVVLPGPPGAAGFAISGFGAGVAFDQTLNPPTSATDLPGALAAAETAITGSATGDLSNIDLAGWTNSLKWTTAAQYVASAGGTNLSAAYDQPFLLGGNVTLIDKYIDTNANPDAFKIVGTLILAIDPTATVPLQAILVGGRLSLTQYDFPAAAAYLYAGFNSTTSTTTGGVLFYTESPGGTPIISFGGGLTFTFTDSSGGTVTNPGTATGSEGYNFTISLSGFCKFSPLAPIGNDANIDITGVVTLTATPSQLTLDLSGSVNVSFLGSLGNISGEFVLLYAGKTYVGPAGTTPFTNNSDSAEIFGAINFATGSAFTALQPYGLTVNGDALLQINTTGNDVTVNLPAPPSADGTPSTAPGTPFTLQSSVIFDLTITGTSPASPNAEVSYAVPGTTITLFDMQGFFDLRFTHDATNGFGVQMFADFSLTFGPGSLGSNLLSFSGFGLFVINGSGVAAAMNVTRSMNIPGFSLSAYFTLVMNTTSNDITFNLPSVTVPGSSGSESVPSLNVYNTNGVIIGTVNRVVIPAGLPEGPMVVQMISGVSTGTFATSAAASPYFTIMGVGTLKLAGVVDVVGAFMFSADSSGVKMGIYAQMTIFGNTLTVNGDAGIYTDGIALNISLMLGTSSNPQIVLIPSVLALKGSFLLQVNTTGADQKFTVGSNTITISAGTLFNVSVNAELNVLGFDLGNVNVNIQESNGVFTASGDLHFSFFGFATLNGAFYFDSTGSYAVYASAYARLGSSGFNIHGSLVMEMANTPNGLVLPNGVHIDKGFQFSVTISGGATAFGITFASISASLGDNNGSLYFSVRVKIGWGWFSFHVNITIHLGTINTSSLTPPPPPPPPILAQVDNGVLQLNLGVDAGNRNTGSSTEYSAQANENYEISYDNDPNSPTYGEIGVYAPLLYSKVEYYSGVTSILVNNTGSSNTTIQIDNGVAVPVNVTFGSGSNQIYLNGSGTATITGTDGADTVYGGTGNVTFNAGSGASFFEGGGTGSTQNIINDPGTVTVVEIGYADYSLVGSSATSAILTYGGNTNTLNGDNISVMLAGVTSGTQTFSVSNYSGAATLDAAGNSASNVTTSITLDTGNLTLNEADGTLTDLVNIVTESNGTTGTITLQSTVGEVDSGGNPVVDANGNQILDYYAYGSLNLYGGAADNTFTVNGWSGTGALTLDGKGGSDTYNLNFQSGGSLAATVADSGATGNDSMFVNGLASGDSINVSNSAVSIGSQVVNYSGIENLTINTVANNETVNVASTSAATTINTASYTDIINVGSLAPTTGGVVSGIQGALNVVGSGNDTMNVDDTGSTGSKTGTLTATTLTGLGMGPSGITYSGLATLNISLGSGGNIFNIQGTGAVTDVNAGSGTNTINIGSQAPVTTGGVVDGIQGALTVVGSGNDTMNVDDTGSTGNKIGTLTATTLTGLGMGGGITYSGLVELNISLGSGNDTFYVTGITNSTVTTIDGGPGTNNAVLSFSSGFAAQNLTLLNFATATLYVGGDFSGLLNDPGAITTATIVGSLTTTGVLNAGAIGVMTIGGDLAGLVKVTGLLDRLTVNGGTPGQIIAGDVHVITVLAGYGNKVLQVTEGGIEREILATPVNGGMMPGTVHFAFVYDSVTDANPQLAIRITDTNPAPRSFNLALVVVNGSTATFNLSLLDSYQDGMTGLSNISLQGDLLTQLTEPELQLFTDLTANSRAGVVLPADSITGVEVSGQLTMGFIDVAGIEGLAFATLISSQSGHSNSPNDFNLIGSRPVLWQILGCRAAMNPATDAFVIPFNETQSVRFYAHDDTGQGMPLVMVFTDQLNDNAPITAYVQLDPALTKKLEPLVQSVDLVGNGGSIESQVSIANITSTGPLGDITVDAPVGTTVGGSAGLGNITAPSIFGSIQVTHGDIYGIIQTTSGDLGQVLLGRNGTIIGVTTIYCSGNLTGQIISRGNLVSSVSIHGTFTGVISAQGDIGAIQRDAGGNANNPSTGHVRSGGNSATPTSILTRFGGIFIQGDDSGQIITLENVFGDVRIDGVMTGRIAAQGQPVAGLAAGRFGILGNVFIRSFDIGAAIVSDGLIGDAAGGTNIFIAENGHDGSGFLAAGGAINLAGSTERAYKLPLFDVIQNAGGSNLSQIQAVFTQNSMPLLFDTGGSLDGLDLIKMDLASMQNTDGTLSGTIL